jgi:RNA polymerase sigma-70 factor (ECF subfamily)
MGLVIHVVNHTAAARGMELTAEDRDDFCSGVFLQVIKDDFALLRRFRGQSSLATYLTVVARRIVVRAMLSRKQAASVGSDRVDAGAVADPSSRHEERISNRDEVEQLLASLEGSEADAVRMYHLESKSYREISQAIGVQENSVGPMLSRARSKLRRASVNPATG